MSRQSGTGAKPAYQPTAVRLLAAAMAEFNEHGFAGTDTNRIARRAGFAPQTFYRWYPDKTAIFVAVYRGWEDEEMTAVAGLLESRAPASALVEAIFEHHRRHLLFRRSLRRLSLEDPLVRRARADSRLRQIVQISGGSDCPAVAAERIGVELLQLERLADALAEGELTDMGLGEQLALDRLAAIVEGLRAWGGVRPGDLPATAEGP